MFLFVIPTAIFVPKAHRTVEFGYYIIHTHSQHWLGSCRVLHGLRIHTFSGYLVISCYREWPQLNITSLVLSIKICIKKEINVTQIYKWHLFIWGLKQVQAMGQSVGDSCLLKRFFFFFILKRKICNWDQWPTKPQVLTLQSYACLIGKLKSRFQMLAMHDCQCAVSMLVFHRMSLSWLSLTGEEEGTIKIKPVK